MVSLKKVIPGQYAYKQYTITKNSKKKWSITENNYFVKELGTLKEVRYFLSKIVSQSPITEETITPSNVISLFSRKSKENSTTTTNTESNYFKETMENNAKIKQRLADERSKNNRSTLRSYRIKKNK